VSRLFRRRIEPRLTVKERRALEFARGQVSILSERHASRPRVRPLDNPPQDPSPAPGGRAA